MTNKLFIIGNGLDLNLQMKTSYDDLKNFIKHKNEKIFDYINEQLFDGNENLWSSFEESVMLKEHNLEDMIASLQNMQDDMLENAEVGGDPLQGDVLSQVEANDYQIESDIKEKTEIILNSKIEEFNDIFDLIQYYLTELLQKEEEKCKLPNVTFKNQVDNNSIFLTFNYTHTLEKVYQIKKDNIKHVHGELNDGVLLLGNSEKRIFSSLIDESALNLDDTERQEYDRLLQEYDRLLKEYGSVNSQDVSSPLIPITHDRTAHAAPYSVDAEEQAVAYNDARKRWIKPIQCSKVQDFLSKFKNIDNIIIAGHSLGIVDKSYFQLLQERYPNATLTLFIHDGGEDKILDNIDDVFPNKKYTQINW